MCRVPFPPQLACHGSSQSHQHWACWKSRTLCKRGLGFPSRLQMFSSLPSQPVAGNKKQFRRVCPQPVVTYRIQQTAKYGLVTAKRHNSKDHLQKCRCEYCCLLWGHRGWQNALHGAAFVYLRWLALSQFVCTGRCPEKEDLVGIWFLIIYSVLSPGELETNCQVSNCCTIKKTCVYYVKAPTWTCWVRLQDLATIPLTVRSFRLIICFMLGWSLK